MTVRGDNRISDNKGLVCKVLYVHWVIDERRNVP